MNDSIRITRLLERINDGDGQAWDELMPRMYEALHGIARRMNRGRRDRATLQTTAVVHEAYLKLVGGEGEWETRRHFERVAARAMRAVVVDAYRARRAQKRGDAWERVLLTDEAVRVSGPDLDVLALNEAIEKLGRLDPDAAEIAELRCFGGHEHEEIARITGRSLRTVGRLWRFVRSWLERELEESDD